MTMTYDLRLPPFLSDLTSHWDLTLYAFPGTLAFWLFSHIQACSHSRAFALITLSTCIAFPPISKWLCSLLTFLVIVRPYLTTLFTVKILILPQILALLIFHFCFTFSIVFMTLCSTFYFSNCLSLEWKFKENRSSCLFYVLMNALYSE